MHDHADLVKIYAILLLIVMVATVISPNFRTPQNIFNVLRQAVALGVVSIGQTMVILTGGIDLSVGSTISLVAVYASGLMAGQPGLGVILQVVLLTLGGALLVGLINAFVITRLKVVPFITTLSVASIVQGLVLLYAKAPKGSISPGFNYFAEGMVGPVPFPVIFLALLVIITFVILTKTVLGRYIIATGGSEVIARLSGIRTKPIILFAYMFCSFTAGVSALFLISRMGIGDPQVGGLNFDRFDLDSIAAVLIGGTRLGGGKGSVMGTVAGILIISVLNNIFNLAEVSSFYQWIVKGFIILGAVMVYTIQKQGKDI
ncbi:MAG: ABC transporter permease [Anaerolineales bacterium]|nr:ABC transporter permease [Anaerolineales bacterium]